MKKLLIIEDDEIIANIHRNKLTVDGYQVEVASDGETGLELLRSFRPDGLLLDIVLPKMSGVDVIRKIRADAEFAKLPIVVFTNTYLTHLIQEAWKAGANKCISKSSYSSKEFLAIMRQALENGGAFPTFAPPPTPVIPPPLTTPGRKAATPPGDNPDTEAEFQAELRKTLIDSLPATLAALRAILQNLAKADGETARHQQIHELYRRIHTLNGNAGIAGLVPIALMADALEALLRELYEKPKNINNSTLRTVASAIDFLGFLFQHGTLPEKQEVPPANILVVDDETISRRAVVHALEKAKLKCVNTEDPNAAYNFLREKSFDLVFLDVDMPGMNGYELCAKLRSLPLHKKTPVVFVTILNDFDNRASSMMSGGNDFIGKPFLFIELTVKALIHILRGKLQPAK
jgi:DNA-binding response OmpR family regulator